MAMLHNFYIFLFDLQSAVEMVVVCHSKGLPMRGDSMGATENVLFNAIVQWNLGLDFVTKQHESLQKLNQFTAKCDTLTRVNFLQCFDAVGWAAGRASGL